MAETRSQALLKEALMREAEEAVASRFENLEARMLKLDSGFKEGLASLLSAIKSMASNSTASDRIRVSETDPSSLNQPQLQDQFRNRQGYSHDPIAQLKNLQETVGIFEYHDQFETIRTRVSLPKEYLVSAYLAGLRLDTQMHVKMFQPKSVRHCFQIGKLYETVHPRKSSNSSMAVGSSNPGWNGNRTSFLNKKEVDSKNEGILGQNKPEKKFPTSEEEPEQEVTRHVFDESPRYDMMKRDDVLLNVVMKNGDDVIINEDHVQIKGKFEQILIGEPSEKNALQVFDEMPRLISGQGIQLLFAEQVESKAFELISGLTSHEGRAMDSMRVQCFDPGGGNREKTGADFENLTRSLVGVHSAYHRFEGIEFMPYDRGKFSLIKGRVTWYKFSLEHGLNFAQKHQKFLLLTGYFDGEILRGNGLEFIAILLPYDRGKFGFIFDDEEEELHCS